MRCSLKTFCDEGTLSRCCSRLYYYRFIRVCIRFEMEKEDRKSFVNKRVLEADSMLMFATAVLVLAPFISICIVLAKMGRPAEPIDVHPTTAFLFLTTFFSYIALVMAVFECVRACLARALWVE